MIQQMTSGQSWCTLLRTPLPLRPGRPGPCAPWCGTPRRGRRHHWRFRDFPFEAAGKGFGCGLVVLVVEHAAEIFAQLPFQLIEALFLQTTGQEARGRPFCIQCVGDKVKKAIETDPARLFTVQENAQTTAEVRILQKNIGTLCPPFLHLQN